jgi:acyl-CoA thioesterase-1
VLLPQAIAAATSIAAFVLFGIVAPPARRRALALLALLAALGSAASEVRWHLGATKLPVPRRLIVIGDSLSSGGFGESSSWPALTGRGHRAVVLNLALPGETASAAVQNQLPELPGAMPGDCVIVAIGGNDMLEGLPSRDFESSLDRILASSREAGRRPVAMLELPIVPGEWRFGAIQRRLARRHGVALIPKRVLAGVLLAPGSTFDGLHPTQQGHERLAREIGRSLGW